MLSAKYHALTGLWFAGILAFLVFTSLFAWQDILLFCAVCALVFVGTHPWTYYRMYPELQLFPERVQHEVLKRLLSRHTLPSSLLLTVALFVAMYFVARSANPSFPLAFVFIPVLSLLPNWLHRVAIRRAMRKELRTYDALLCLDCGYNLRGSVSSDRCPECGTLIWAGP